MAAAILLFCFQGAGRAWKRPGDLVQEERKNKALRGFVHQVRAGRAPKSPRDLVQRERKNKALREFVHQVSAPPAGICRPSAQSPAASQKSNKKTSNLSCSFVVRDQGFEPWTP